MTLRYFEPATTPTRTHEVVQQVQAPSQVVEHTAAKTHLIHADVDWGWEDLRNYVVTQIEEHFGAFPRDSVKEAAIFKRFTSTFGTDAPRVARYAFEVCEGYWAGAPISVNRFCKASDEYFAEPILRRLNDC